jgi:hypothetical protein
LRSAVRPEGFATYQRAVHIIAKIVDRSETGNYIILKTVPLKGVLFHFDVGLHNHGVIELFTWFRAENNTTKMVKKEKIEERNIFAAEIY